MVAPIIVRHEATASVPSMTAATSGPPTMSDSLLAKARVRPARRAARVGRRPAAPAIPFTTTSQGHAAASALASGPAHQSQLAESLDLKPEAAQRLLRAAAAGFFAQQADQGEDGWWLFPSRKQRFRRALEGQEVAILVLADEGAIEIDREPGHV